MPAGLFGQSIGPVAGFRKPASPRPAIRTGFQAPETNNRERNALLGGLIGGVAGVVTCTVISNLAKDPGTGFSTCTTKGYLIFGGAGFGIGALIGALVR